MLSLLKGAIRSPAVSAPALSEYAALLRVRHHATAAPPQVRLDKILIANRGEIACRIINTARKLGVRTVAVFSDADRNSMHTQMADEAHYIGPAPSRESYLRGDVILEVAKKTGAQAIHPGYGFLSENTHFADACEKNNIIFIGPPSSAIRDMGSKSESKKIMIAANVPVIQGYHGDNQDPRLLAQAADKIGYPVLIKAVLGGGGKGMRVVHTPDQFREMLESAKREAMKSFSDDRVLVEKYVVDPRHVEVQVFADKWGDCVYLFERDCSIQRRHQKIIEEAPAPGLSEETRRSIGEAAVRAAKAVGYVGAGTVEFIMNKDQKFYFMEMNTRLQVEHPITELITRQDLVEWQLKVASGERLPMKQSDLKIHGHAFEARVYAEDPRNNFLPVTGKIHYMQPPPASEGVRIDTGVRQGDSVSVYYDPMISKLIVWGDNRQSALRKFSHALSRYQIGGIKTNLEILKDLAVHPAFTKDAVTTDFIKHHEAELMAPKPSIPAASIAQAAVAQVLEAYHSQKFDYANSADPNSPWGLPAFRVNHLAQDTVKFVADKEPVTATVTHMPNGAYSVQVTRGKSRPEVVPVTNVTQVNNNITAQVGDTRLTATVVRTEDQINIFNDDGSVHVLDVPPPKFLHKEQTLDLSAIMAPMTGRIEKVLVQVGQAVTKDTPLVVVEAMKMEHVLKAPKDGVVEKLGGKPGDIVQQNSLLVKLMEAATKNA
eukprot:comp21488_c1_seq1/m.29766 comp21488_c1_seq1/g.29766  ORF comp21488_c1_seq1/g.29766 comp21488_c1_seq1/m.29766 type:complete len:716 (-) comp21488_c1_seq1:92-2239(-)